MDLNDKNKHQKLNIIQQNIRCSSSSSSSSSFFFLLLLPLLLLLYYFLIIYSFELKNKNKILLFDHRRNEMMRNKVNYELRELTKVGWV